WQNISHDANADITCLGVPGIRKVWPSLESEILLRHPLSFFKTLYIADRDSEIGAHNHLISGFDCLGDSFHCVGGTLSFFDVAIHCARLVGASVYRIPQFDGLVPVNTQLSKSNQGERASDSYRPPFVRRFFLAVGGFLSYFVFVFWGLKCFDHQRRLLGSALIGWLLGGLELLLLWPTHFLWSWG